MQQNPRADVVPINKRTFTLAIKDVPATALIKKLEKSGIEFRFDARQLKRSGIDLKQRIQMRVTMADADAFFHAIFDQMQIRFEIQGTTVRLEPR
jgi:tRNA(Leu) C34 or U34 (ribose-2'-O)-methylase TrmL